MYIHIGSDSVVFDKNIVGIFDIDTCSFGKKTRDFLAVNEKRKDIINIADDLPKSFIIIKSKTGSKVYISGVSSATIKKRI